jgi:hypothetical protein
MHYILGGIVGLAIGVFCPSWARYLKSEFGKGGKAVLADVKVEAKAVEKKL